MTEQALFERGWRPGPRCPHGQDRPGCAACAREEFDAHVATQLAAQDPESVDRLRAEFDAWLASPDAQLAAWGDCWPSTSPEVP